MSPFVARALVAAAILTLGLVPDRLLTVPFCRRAIFTNIDSLEPRMTNCTQDCAHSSSRQIARQQLGRGGEGDVRGVLWPAIDERALSAMAVRGSTLRGRGAACELDGGGWEVVDKHSIEHSYAIERMIFRRRTTTCRAPPLPCPPARAPRADMSLPCRIPPSLSAESPRHPLVCTSNRLRSSAEVLQAPARGGQIGGAQAGRLEHAAAAGLAAGTGAGKSLAAVDGGVERATSHGLGLEWGLLLVLWIERRGARRGEGRRRRARCAARRGGRCVQRKRESRRARVGCGEGGNGENQKKVRAVGHSTWGLSGGGEICSNGAETR